MHETTMQWIKIADIALDANIREDTGANQEKAPHEKTSRAQEKYAELYASVKKNGLLQPVIVRINPKANGKGKELPYVLVGGYRRFDVVSQLIREDKWRWECVDEKTGTGAPGIPAVVMGEEKPLTDVDATLAAIAENAARSDLAWYEAAEAVVRAREQGAAPGTIATTSGYSKSHVSNLSVCGDIVPAIWGEIKDLARRGVVTVPTGDKDDRGRDVLKSLLNFSFELGRLPPAEQKERWAKSTNPTTVTDDGKNPDPDAPPPPKAPTYKVKADKAREAFDLLLVKGDEATPRESAARETLAYILGESLERPAWFPGARGPKQKTPKPGTKEEGNGKGKAGK